MSAQDLKPSVYDRASSWLIASLILVGVLNAALLAMWYSATFEAKHSQVPPIDIPKIRAVNFDFSSGPRMMAQPELGELTDIKADPTLNRDSLKFIEEVVRGISPSIPDMGSIEIGDGTDPKTNPNRQPGPPDGGSGLLPPWERWELRFDSARQQRYAAQLDHFGIELGVVGGSPLVDYLRDLSQPDVAMRKGKSSDEKRIYMTWKAGNLAMFDLALVDAAGIPTEQRIILHLLPASLVQQLEDLEASHATQPEEAWLKTVFGLRPRGDGYEWFVVSQTYR
jgi:hypothetical protein